MAPAAGRPRPVHPNFAHRTFAPKPLEALTPVVVKLSGRFLEVKFENGLPRR
jgi:hypothetical protein